MTIKELIQFLETQDQELQVAYDLHSEHRLMETPDIKIKRCCAPREDGWVHDERPDKPAQDYLMFPGN